MVLKSLNVCVMFWTLSFQYIAYKRNSVSFCDFICVCPLLHLVFVLLYLMLTDHSVILFELNCQVCFPQEKTNNLKINAKYV